MSRRGPSITIGGMEGRVYPLRANTWVRPYQTNNVWRINGMDQDFSAV